MLFAGIALTGIAVGAGVPVAWTYIAEESPDNQRARHVGTSQCAQIGNPILSLGNQARCSQSHDSQDAEVSND
jgi:inositol transporter-like SP family MFS transporter